jgi:hypothetical protein
MEANNVQNRLLKTNAGEKPKKKSGLLSLFMRLIARRKANSQGLKVQTRTTKRYRSFFIGDILIKFQEIATRLNRPQRFGGRSSLKCGAN